VKSGDGPHVVKSGDGPHVVKLGDVVEVRGDGVEVREDDSRTFNDIIHKHLLHNVEGGHCFPVFGKRKDTHKSTHDFNANMHLFII
jgi:hypothetical protein